VKTEEFINSVLECNSGDELEAIKTHELVTACRIGSVLYAVHRNDNSMTEPLQNFLDVHLCGVIRTCVAPKENAVSGDTLTTQNAVDEHGVKTLPNMWRHRVCPECSGSRWRVFMIDNKDGRKPRQEVRPCPYCNHDGKASVGVTIEETRKYITQKQYVSNDEEPIKRKIEIREIRCDECGSVMEAEDRGTHLRYICHKCPFKHAEMKRYIPSKQF